MTIVVDASIAVRWLFRLNPIDSAESLIRPGETLIAPDLVIAEVTNAAWKLIRFEKFDASRVAAVLSEAPKTFDEIVPSALLADGALQIAIELRHPVYDCFYLALAEQRDCRMVTADDRLIGRCARTRFARRVKLLSVR